MNSAVHVPVLLDRVLELLEPAVAGVSGAVIVDATLGLGGHSAAMLDRFENARVVGIDRDTEALKRAGERLAPYGERARLAHAVHDEIRDVLATAGIERTRGVLFDLGVSSMQLDFAERGFAYAQDGPLDMRMNADDPLSAADVVNEYSVDELTRVLRDWGEERFARRIATAIATERQNAPLRTTAELVALVRESIPAAARRKGGNPAKRTFQALRIEVNDELRVFARALDDALELTDIGGRVIVLAYHSLEDRIAKRTFARVTEMNAPRDLPVVPAELAPKFKAVVRGAEKASDREIAENPRATSVRMRAVERIAA